MEFIIVDRRGEPGRIFAYGVYLVPVGADEKHLRAKYIGGTDTEWGARRKIRKERRRIEFRESETMVIHRETL
ncbi:hypothetical protein [Micromonospora sp. WMMD736]|uniref:hypothetical protein n=1 Tax=Micromonospora sp. WMMD736 TaxID=3404112 RepID=UPI003B938CFF